MFFRFLFLFVIFFHPLILFSQIREVSSVEEILGEITPDVLVIFDIDNTLIRPCQMLGSDEWVDYTWRKKEKEGVSSEDLRRSVIETWIAIQVLTKMRLIEEAAPSVIEKLQKMHVPVMALTARSEPVARSTRLQLQSVGIDVSKTRLSDKNFYIEDDPSVWFIDGILFTAGRDKGKSLLSFLRQVHYIPHKVVFIDDKKSSLESVEKIGRGIFQCIGLRYNRADSIVKAFDPAVADKELEYLKNAFLSDEEAKRLSFK